ncbi:hypothetical protein Syun_006199 [Stephania yunnanensis]|uniref:Uncharacterized protein n=1 Tax=Stephania yunnanensis TaxID=152371 RepID=A0AAP0KXK8_9MAGN
MDLSGQILNSLQFRSSLQNLDLSRNSITQSLHGRAQTSGIRVGGSTETSRSVCR